MGYLDDRFFTYLIPSPKDKEWGLYVTDAGRTRIPPHAEYPPPGHPKDYNFTIEKGRTLHTYQLVYITRGTGTFESKETSRIAIEAGTLFMMFPGVWHSYCPDRETGWNEHWVGFAGDYADHLCSRKFFSPQSPAFKTGYDESLINLFDTIIDMIRNEPPGYQQMISAFTLEILAKFNSLRQSNNHDSTDIQSIIRQAKSTIVEQMTNPIDMPGLANSLGVSYSWFRYAFKQYTGLSPHKYQLELKIEKAKFLLRNTSESIKEISNNLGFESPYYFSRLFKKKTGVNPMQWKMTPITEKD